MRQIVRMITLLAAAILLSAPAYAAKWGEKGASTEAYEHASEKAVFHRVSDWFATRGKSETERQAIIAERDAKRAAQRAEKEARRVARELERDTKGTRVEIEKQTEKAKKELRGYGQ